MMPLVQAIAEYGVTSGSGASLGARLGQMARTLGNEAGQVVDAAVRNPGATTLVVAGLLIFMIVWSLGTR
ncbi:MAG: hypothetical protein P8188_11365 [Gemmatimonadota bacterium]|jgi:hypothetical protein